MSEKVSHQALITAARKEIRARKCPRHIRKDVWANMIDLLVVIAGYLPDCWPSERTLAKKMGKDQKSIARWIARAREEGLLVTTPRPMENSWRTGQAYHLVCLSESLRATIARGQFQRSLDLISKSSSSKKTDTGTPSGFPLGRAAPGGLEAIPMPRASDDDWSSPAIGSDPRAPLGEPVEIPAADPAVHLARRFDAKWARLLKTHPDYREVRGSSRGMAIGYLRKTMLTQITPEHAEAYMDAFIEAVAFGDVAVKEGQFAFEKFTHWWGREPMEDPAIEREARERAQAAVDAYRAMDQTPVPFLDRIQFPRSS